MITKPRTLLAAAALVAATSTSAAAHATASAPPAACAEATQEQVLTAVTAAMNGDHADFDVLICAQGDQSRTLNALICAILASLAGTYGPWTINSQGDVFINGEPFWECPPYDIT